jgi:hypothetical protein
VDNTVYLYDDILWLDWFHPEQLILVRYFEHEHITDLRLTSISLAVVITECTHSDLIDGITLQTDNVFGVD